MPITFPPVATPSVKNQNRPAPALKAIAMDALVAVDTMDFEGTLTAAAAPDSPIATTIAPMGVASPAEEKRAAIGGRDAKPKAVKKVLSKEEKGLKERNAAAAIMEAT
jgi:hypothetical protein